MELIMESAKVRELVEQTMQRLLSGLIYQICRIVRHHPYNDMAQLLHQACQAESSVVEEAKSSRPTAITFFFMDIVSWTAYCWSTRFIERGGFQGTHNC
jgi:hypothetical protein